MDKEELLIREPSKRLPRVVFLYAFIVLAVLLSLFLINEKRNRTVIGSLLLDPAENLKTTNGYTNIALMGAGGEGHDAPDLTDTMIFVSINHTNSRISMIPIPRDIWVDSMQAKINTAYHYGNDRREGGGIDLTKSAIAEISGQPIHYALILSFDGFVKLIDSVGGVEVDVLRSIDDFKYPVPGNEAVEPEEDRYEHLHFDQGIQQMDGEIALKFVRSRYAQGEEGTDFARNARQQQLIKSFASKVLTTKTLLNPQNAIDLISKINDAVDTDIAVEEYASFLKIAANWNTDSKSFYTGSLEELLTAPKNKSPYKGQWVLIPSVDWQDIHGYVEETIK